MTLAEALTLSRRARETVRTRRLLLACGFEPLHLITFLQGYFAQRFPDQAVELETGLYGDLEGTLATKPDSQEAVLIVIEWGDLDARLGLRSSGGWARSVEPDIVANCRDRLERLLDLIRHVSSRIPVVMTGPALDIPLLGHTAGWHGAPAKLELQRLLAGFLADAGALDRVSILDPGRLDRLSPASGRRDPLMEIKAGFPYTPAHTSALAGLLLTAAFPPNPMKGLITDLDGTLWSGVVGEEGPNGMAWSLSENGQVHGLYQQVLRQFSEMGVLLAIASKNELSVVEHALRREDLLVPANAFYPVLADWGPKSRHIGAILKAWNISADSAVFVDDSQMELSEVQSAFPGLTTFQFPAGQPARVVAMLEDLRDRFGKAAIHEEDRIRQSSLRSAAEVSAAGNSPDGLSFIRGLHGRVSFASGKRHATARWLELVNKTNQFNLNGTRISESEWLQRLEDPAGFVVGVSYEDRFGPLGVIAVAVGRWNGAYLELENWVMSCRAFSRRIEHHTLGYLTRRFAGRTLRLPVQPTERNQPLRQFMQSIGWDGEDPLEINEVQWKTLGEELPHEVRELADE